ncbi:hypothetical protein [Salinigranum halophilum]|uniref:hypothetical protein n=1 Tax=Salinigranum halophilum TaxID=2565931 RepID=UPI0010A7A251|nr:hypothetical protein [Salinigranum halophilum]
MDHSRRRMLTLASSLSLPLLAGCTGMLGSSDEGDSDSAGGSDDSGGGGSAADATATPTETPTPTPEPTSEFLVRTRNVMDEISWFGTQYQRARRRYLLEVKPVTETIAKLKQVNTLTSGDVEELRSKTTALATYVSEELAPHFELDAALRRGNNIYVRNFEAAVQQNDTAAQQDTLGRLDVFYTRATNESYLDQHLSAHPIEAPLHDYLSSDTQGQAIFGVSYPPGDNFTTQTFSDEYSDRASDEVRPHEHEFPTGQRVYAHAHTYDAGHDIYDHENERPNGIIYAFSDGAIDILEDTQAWRERLGDYEPAYTNVFDATVTREGRVDYAYVMANRLVTKTDSDEQFAGVPIFVQRFESPEAAATGVDTLFSTTLGEDGTVRLANREWTRVFYDYDGPNLYANLHQIGEFILVTGVSPRPHRDRSREQQWPEQLKLSWLGMEEPATPTPQSDG